MKTQLDFPFHGWRFPIKLSNYSVMTIFRSTTNLQVWGKIGETRTNSRTPTPGETFSQLETRIPGDGQRRSLSMFRISVRLPSRLFTKVGTNTFMYVCYVYFGVYDKRDITEGRSRLFIWYPFLLDEDWVTLDTSTSTRPYYLRPTTWSVVFWTEK